MTIPYWFGAGGLFPTGKPLLAELKRNGLGFDQKLMRALQASASKPKLDPEDFGFPDSYLTLALYRLNSILTRVVELDEKRYNLFPNTDSHRRARRSGSSPVIVSAGCSTKLLSLPLRGKRSVSATSCAP
jgi:hypothetical protein